MSGTSLDGLDIALCAIRGSGLQTQVTLKAFTTVVYTDAFRQAIRAVFSKKMVDLETLCLLNPWVGLEHGRMVLSALSEWQVNPAEVDLLASHGQTIYHAPQSLHGRAGFGHATLQIGDGDHLAVTTGIITLSDFRQKHIAGGGEGAPLAVYGDYFIFSQPGEDRILLNIGGIANFTWLPANMDPGEIFSTDTGPGNTLMDAYVQQHFNLPFDAEAGLARQGEESTALLSALLDHGFFQAGFPKTTGPELFHLEYLRQAQSSSGTLGMGHHDVLATLAAFTATTVADAMEKIMDPQKPFKVFASGGGMHNPLVMEKIKNRFPGLLMGTTADLQVNPDAKEAVLFAVLANEAIAGGDTPIGSGKAGIPAITMGKISFPG
ncbi:MAG: anhydro-N-acetylmuramic acid kinase [Sphingobacteriia bacterium]|nr:MAG: anhydro-N-acetylmuramic acid kinase [Sphingobacteriia bacterium]